MTSERRSDLLLISRMTVIVVTPGMEGGVELRIPAPELLERPHRFVRVPLQDSWSQRITRRLYDGDRFPGHVRPLP